MAKRKKQNKLFLLSWDIHGLESLLDLTTLEQLRQQEEQMRMIKILSDPDARDPGDQTMAALHRSVNSILMRARVNSHRDYEVYTVQTHPHVTEQNMWEMFAENNTHAKELIRERGTKLY